MPDLGSPLVPKRRLASELRRLREQSSLTGEKVAKRLKWSPSKVSRYELARTALKPQDVAQLLDLYGVRGAERDELLALAVASTKKGWWDAYTDDLPEELAELIGMEDEANSARTWQIECVPGLLQTEPYALAVNRGFQEITAMPPVKMDRRVAVRLHRQQVLTRPDPLSFSAVVDESVLWREVGGPEVMRGQLAELTELARLPNVNIMILPFRPAPPVIAPSFFILEFGSAENRAATPHPTVAFAEHLVSSRSFDDEQDIYHYKQVYDLLEQAALSPGRSAALISDICERRWS